jgi:O-antigen/teichoic acid export membrane protein
MMDTLEPAQPTAAPARPMTRSLLLSTIAAASAALLFLLQVLAGTFLSVDSFGAFGLALRFAMIGEALMDIGIHQITIRAIARDRRDAPALLHNSLALKAFSGVAMLIVMGGVAFYLRPETSVRAACLLMLVSAVLRSYLLTARGVFLGLERFGHDCLVIVIDRVLLLLTGAAMLWLGYGLTGLAVAFVVARVATVSLALALARQLVGRLKLEFNVAVWRDLQQRGLPVGVFLIVLNLYSYIDTVMLGKMTTLQETGLYTAAFTLYEGLSYIPSILASVLTPRLSKLWAVDQDAYRRLATRSMTAALVLGVAVAAPVWFFAGPLLSVFDILRPGAETTYTAASTALRLLVSGLAFIFVTWILQTIALAAFRERLLLQVTTTGALVNIALNLALIPRYGRNGAALATLIGEGLTVGLLFAGLRGLLRPTGRMPSPPSS